MKKIGIIVDSFPGYSRAEVEKHGLEFINHIVVLNGKPLKEGIEIELKDCIDEVKADLTAKTSMPAIGVVIEKFEELSKIYDKIIYIPMNKGFSSTFSTATAASSEFDKVSVVSTSLVGSAIIESAQEMMKMIEAGKTEEEAITYLRKVESTSEAYVIPKNLDSLIRSGRLVSTKKFVMQKAKLIPRLEVTMEGFKVSKVGRNMGKLITASVEKIVKALEGKHTSYSWEVIHTGDIKTKNKVIEAFKAVGITKIKETWSSSVVAVHTGIGAIGINVWKK